jgi:hypothetical protein
MMPDLLNVIQRIDDHQLQPYLAPIPVGGNRVDVLTIQDNIPYWFKVNAPAGWWLLDKDTVVRDATVRERFEYLRELPRFYVFALYPVRKVEGEGYQDWLCTPFNLSDAEQRGWKNGEPRVLHLVNVDVKPLSIMSTRNLAGTLIHELDFAPPVYSIHKGIYDRDQFYKEFLYSDQSLDSFNVPNAEKHAATFIRQRLIDIRIEQERLERERQMQSVEGRMKFALQASGAELVDYTEMMDGYKITWEYDGHEFTMDFDRNLRVESAGVCLRDEEGGLGDTQGWHSLSTIVDVIKEARNLDGR